MKKGIVAFISTLILVMLTALCGCGGKKEDGNNGGGEPKTKSFCQIVSKVTGKEILKAEDAPYFFTIGADDSYCEIDTNPLDLDEYSSSTALDYIKNMNKELGLPDYLFNDMIHTSYSQGKQESTFDGIKVKYYYHPDKGLNVSYYRI